MESIDIAKLTKLESFDFNQAPIQKGLTNLLRFTNVMSLKMQNEHECTYPLTNILPHFPLLRELETGMDAVVLAKYKGAFLTKLRVSSNVDARFLTHFDRLEVLDMSFVGLLTNTAALSRLTR